MIWLCELVTDGLLSYFFLGFFADEMLYHISVRKRQAQG